jgi:3-isopropylmalate dehydrogenase
MSTSRYTIACLSGDGIGPELMAEASRALAEAGRLHGFQVDELHPAFAGEAVARHGHPLPASTRAACRRADAVLVALTKEPALDGVKAELDLTWRVQRVRLPNGDIAIVSPLDDEVEPLAVRRAFDMARSRRARVAAVGDGPAWNALVSWEADRHAGVEVERLSLREVLPLLMNDPERFCVVVTQREHAELVSDLAAASRNGTRIVASGRLSPTGPGVFGPTHGSAPDIAGQGVANPSGILLATALMLGEGLGQRSAAKTLERAVSRTIAAGVRTADLDGRGVAATTRDFMDAVLDLMPTSRTDVEFFPGPA